MADMSQYYDALRNADAAGDHEAAQKIADYIHGQEQAAPQPTAAETPSERGIRGIAEFALGNILQGAQSMAEPVAQGMPSLETPLKGVQDIRAKQGKAPQQPVQVPTLMDVAKSSDPNLASQLQPRNVAEKYSAAALQTLPSAIGGEGSLARRAVGAALSGVGAKVGGDIAGTPGAIVGGLIGGAIAAPKAPSTRTGVAAEESARAGIPLTIGQEQESTSLKTAEGLLSKSLLGQTTAYKDKVRQAQAGVASVAKLADQISVNPQNAEDLGSKLSDALTKTVTHYDQLRSADAARDYGVVRQLAQDRPVIKYTETVNALNKIIDETRNIPSGDSKRIYNQAIAMRDDLVLGNNPRTFKVTDAMQTRRTWGQAARGTGNVFTDVDPNISRRYAGQLFGAINKDFDVASTAQTPYAQALAKANKRYADYSKSIDYVRKSSLASLVGEDVVDAAFSGARGTTKAPERLAERYLNLQPSQARQVTNILRRQAPGVLEDTKAYVLRDMLNKSISTFPGEPPMSFDKFLSQYKKMEPKMKEMGFSPKELADIRDVTNTMSRAVSKTGSPTMAGNVTQAVVAVAHPMLLLPQVVLAKALLTPSGRALLRKAYGTGNQTVKYQATRALAGMYTEERDREGANGAR